MASGVAHDLPGFADDAVEARVHDRRVLAARRRRVHGLVEAPARLLVSAPRISSGSASSSDAAYRSSERATWWKTRRSGQPSVGRLPVELRLGEPGRALDEKRADWSMRQSHASRSGWLRGSRSPGSVTVDGTQPSVGVGTTPSFRHASHWSIWFR